MYNVVIRNVRGASMGVITHRLFQDKQCFDNWYNEEMRNQFQVVEEGISVERAMELCSAPEAMLAATNARAREMHELMKIRMRTQL